MSSAAPCSKHTTPFVLIDIRGGIGSAGAALKEFGKPFTHFFFDHGADEESVMNVHFGSAKSLADFRARCDVAILDPVFKGGPKHVAIVADILGEYHVLVDFVADLVVYCERFNAS